MLATYCHKRGPAGRWGRDSNEAAGGQGTARARHLPECDPPRHKLVPVAAHGDRCAQHATRTWQYNAYLAIQRIPGNTAHAWQCNARLAMQRTPGNATHAWRKTFALACNARLAAIPRTPCNTTHTWHATHAVHNAHAAHKRCTWRAARRRRRGCVCASGALGEYRRGGYHRRVRNMHEKNRASRSRACDAAMLQRSPACCCCNAVCLCCNPYTYVATRALLLLQRGEPRRPRPWAATTSSLCSSVLNGIHH
jgi:hypothetical protein